MQIKHIYIMLIMLWLAVSSGTVGSSGRSVDAMSTIGLPVYDCKIRGGTMAMDRLSRRWYGTFDVTSPLSDCREAVLF